MTLVKMVTWLVFTYSSPSFSTHMQFFEAEKERIGQFYIVSPEGYSRNWDIDWDHVIGSPYFGSMHWHRGRMPQHFVASEITQKKKSLVAFAGKIREFSGECLIFML